MRRYRQGDQDQVLALIDTDRLPGHPRAMPRTLDDALGHVLAQLGDCQSVHAFDFATALTQGLEALPARHRAATATTLCGAGFTATDLWRYMRRELPAAEKLTAGPPAGMQITVNPAPDPPGWTLTANRGGSTIGEATVGAPHSGVGVLWWLGVSEAQRGRGVGRALLRAALAQLRDAGATEVILYVDDDQPPGGDRDRRAANRLYESAGFHEVDRLISFTRAVNDSTRVTSSLAARTLIMNERT